MRSLRSQIHIVQRTFGVVNAGFDNMEVSVGGGETRMPHKALQVECIAAGFQHMRSKTMSQRMNSAWFNDPCLSFVYFEHNVLPTTHRDNPYSICQGTDNVLGWMAQKFSNTVLAPPTLFAKGLYIYPG